MKEAVKSLSTYACSEYSILKNIEFVISVQVWDRVCLHLLMQLHSQDCIVLTTQVVSCKTTTHCCNYTVRTWNCVLMECRCSSCGELVVQATNPRTSANILLSEWETSLLCPSG